jgi:hypothetical protein
MGLRKTFLAGLAVTGLPALFYGAIRPWYLRWGASEADLARPLPCDDWVPHPRMTSTMAISIDAPTERVWPWLVQVGDPPRAGYYSYTWLERLAGLRIENAGRILPEFQEVQVGDVLDKNGTMTVRAVEPGRSLVLGPPESFEIVKCTWAFLLHPENGGTTRLITRVHADWSYRRILAEQNALAWPMWLLIEPGAFIMTRKMLMEIRRLAEASA